MNFFRLMFFWTTVLCLQSCGKNRPAEAASANVFYTCSMDPQVMEKKPGKCPICRMELTKIVIDMAHAGKPILKISEQGRELANIQIDTLRERSLGGSVTLTGTVRLDENSVQSVASKISGRIEKLYVRAVGERVAKGQKLYDLYSEELTVAQQDYLLALEKKRTALSGAVDYDRMIAGAKSKLSLWGMTEGQMKELNISHTFAAAITVFSPAAGTVLRLDAREGDYLKEGAEVVQMADLSKLWVEAQLTGAESGNLRAGQAAEIALGDPGGAKTIGLLIFISPQIDAGSRVNIARFQLESLVGQATPGMMAYVTIQKNSRAALAVPTDGVVRSAKAAYVWTLNSDSTFERKKITTGVQNNRWTEITSGLKAGDAVVSSGAYLIQSEYVFRNGAAETGQ